MKRIFTSLFLCSIVLTSCTPTSRVLNEENISLREYATNLKSDIPVDFIPESYTFVAAGDSLTQGVGDSSNRGGYVHFLEELLEEEKGIKSTDFYNFGVKGNRTSQLLERLKTNEVKGAVEKADVVMITIGGNDIMKVVRENFSNLDIKDFDKEKKFYEQTLRTIISTVRDTNPVSTILLVGLYNPFFKWFSNVKELDIVMEDWNNTSQSILLEYEDTHFVDIATLFRMSDENLLWTDYFHPNDRGYELIADEVYTVIKEKVLTALAEKKLKLKQGGTAS